MRAVVEFDREEWVKLNTCKFCVGSHLHSCTGYDCKEAVKKAEEYFEKTVRRNRTMDDIKRGEIFYIARGGGQQAGVSSLRTDPQLLSAMTRTTNIRE